MDPRLREGQRLADADARQHSPSLSDKMSGLALLETTAHTGPACSSPTPVLKTRSPQQRIVAAHAHTSYTLPKQPRALRPHIRRSTSVISLHHRSSSPALSRRTSTASLHTNPDASPSVGASRLSIRRSASNMGLGPQMFSLNKPAPPTAETIASNYLAQDLRQHTDGGDSVGCKTVVVMHDDCYGHRFSRLKTKDTIHSIVERPERMQASAMGISAAYVRLGQRHSGGRHAPHPLAEPPSDKPFGIIKSSRMMSLSAEAVTAVHGKEWMKELQGLCSTAPQKVAAGSIEIARTPSAIGAPKDQFHTGDLYLCADSINAFEAALGAVCHAVDLVFQGTSPGQGPKQAFACVRPPGHHCSSDWPSGFCWLNNVHVGIQHAVQKYGLTHAAVIDFDLHHGDGSQDITWAHNERMSFSKSKSLPNHKKNYIGYYSLHDINSFPCEYGDREKCQMASLCVDNAHGQSIWNVHLQQWQTAEEFWHLYETKYRVLIDKARNFLQHRTRELGTGRNQPVPRAAIFISAGFDASEHEGDGMQRHSVKVLTEFYARFTQDIVKLANEQGTGVDGRVISVLEGGYSDKALISGILSHISGLCDGDLTTAQYQAIDQNRNETRPGISGLPAWGSDSYTNQASVKYSSEWWDDAYLDTLVHHLHPVEAEAGHRSEANKSHPATNYTSPTHASTMKVVDVTKLRVSSFGSPTASPVSPRPLTPPPPDVEWVTACSELCKLLIPKNRSISSLTQDDLNPKAGKTKKGHVPAAAPSSLLTVPAGRNLRERKINVPFNPAAKEVMSRKEYAHRRQTVGNPSSYEPDQCARQLRRKASIDLTFSTCNTPQLLVGLATTPPPTKSPGIKVKTIQSSGKITPARDVDTRSGSIQAGFKTPGIHEQAGRMSSQVNPDAMDSLAATLKRITIKVPSNEEYSARHSGAVPIAAKVTAAAKRPGSRIAKPQATTLATKTATIASRNSDRRDADGAKVAPFLVPQIKHLSSSKTMTCIPIARIPSPTLPQTVQTETCYSMETPIRQKDQAPSFISGPEKTQTTANAATVPVNPTPFVRMLTGAAPVPINSHAYTNIDFITPNKDVSVLPAAVPVQSISYPNGVQWMPMHGIAAAPAAKQAQVTGDSKS